MKLKSSTWLCVVAVVVPIVGWLAYAIALHKWDILIDVVKITAAISTAGGGAILICKSVSDDL